MIKIKEDIQIGNIILEKGDKIEILKESLSADFFYYFRELVKKYGDKNSKALAEAFKNDFLFAVHELNSVDGYNIDAIKIFNLFRF